MTPFSMSWFLSGMTSSGGLFWRDFFLVLAETGFRVSEALALGWEHLDREGRIAESPRDGRLVPLSRGALRAFDSRAEGKEWPGDELVFRSPRTRRAVTKMAVAKAMRRGLLAAGIRGYYTPMVFRRRLARELSEKGFRRDYIRRFLGLKEKAKESR